jgi:hypothetical protein
VERIAAVQTINLIFHTCGHQLMGPAQESGYNGQRVGPT